MILNEPRLSDVRHSFIWCVHREDYIDTNWNGFIGAREYDN